MIRNGALKKRKGKRKLKRDGAGRCFIAALGKFDGPAAVMCIVRWG